MLAPPAGIHSLVEHTSINPNKAAHIGHLRNAILGDTFVRLLRAAGQKVDIQNYIDNTGVQVADIVVGSSTWNSRNSLADVRSALTDIDQEKNRVLRTRIKKISREQRVAIDYVCWRLYARDFAMALETTEQNQDKVAERKRSD